MFAGAKSPLPITISGRRFHPPQTFLYQPHTVLRTSTTVRPSQQLVNPFARLSIRRLYLPDILQEEVSSLVAFPKFYSCHPVPLSDWSRLDSCCS